MKKTIFITIFIAISLLFIVSLMKNNDVNKMMEKAEIWIENHELRIQRLNIEKEKYKFEINKDLSLKENLRNKIKEYLNTIQSLRNRPNLNEVSNNVSNNNEEENSIYTGFYNALNEYLTLDIGFDEKVKKIIESYEKIISEKDIEITYLKDLSYKLSRIKKRFCLSIGPGFGINSSGKFNVYIGIQFGYIVK